MSGRKEKEERKEEKKNDNEEDKQTVASNKEKKDDWCNLEVLAEKNVSRVFTLLIGKRESWRKEHRIKEFVTASVEELVEWNSVHRIR